MEWFNAKPASYRINNQLLEWTLQTPAMAMLKQKPHDSHPSLDNLLLLVFEAVLEVVCVSLPGYVIARLGHFDAEKQKFLANLNVMLFTPCLIFTKLASQLNADKLIDLAVIPVIFIIQTFISYVVSVGVGKAFRLKKRPANFVTAMGVFGNSNSLPISLVISLSQTLKGLHWDRIKGDTDDEVAARGILYLLIFQQLGQLVRWSWGYHVLLAPKSRYEEYRDETIEEGRYTDEPPNGALIPELAESSTEDNHSENSYESDVYEPAGRTPVAGTSTASPTDSEDETGSTRKRLKKYNKGTGGVDGDTVKPAGEPDEILSFPRMRDLDDENIIGEVASYHGRTMLGIRRAVSSTKRRSVRLVKRAYKCLPRPMRVVMNGFGRVLLRVYSFVWEFMNPPLWAMLFAIVVASVPDLQRLFFKEGTFINNSVTRAVSQTGGVAVPLILVVLGANLARNTQNHESKDPEEEQIGTRLLIASLISRMLLPTLIMAPIIALFAKYFPVSIVDDPIFVVVCFLLTGAPSALQLAQICQINEVYEGVMSKILFQSYVIWILPSTLVLVMLALETVEWALQ